MSHFCGWPKIFLNINSEHDFSNQHFNTICGQAFKSLGFVMWQPKKFNDRNVILTLCYSNVLSKFEYNALVSHVNPSHEQKYKTYRYYSYLYSFMFVAGMLGVNALELKQVGIRWCTTIHFSIIRTMMRLQKLAVHCLLRTDCGSYASMCLLALPPVRIHTARYAPTSTGDQSTVLNKCNIHQRALYLRSRLRHVSQQW